MSYPDLQLKQLQLIRGLARAVKAMPKLGRDSGYVSAVILGYYMFSAWGIRLSIKLKSAGWYVYVGLEEFHVCSIRLTQE